jgi:hypothetical protein
MFLSRGSIVDAGVVVFAPDGSHVGAAVPVGWAVPPDAVPWDQSSYDAMRQLYSAQVIVTYDPAINRW